MPTACDTLRCHSTREAGGTLGSSAHLPQLPAERLFGDADIKLVQHPLHQIDHTPSHHAVDGGYRAVLDRSGQGGAVRVG